jgi:uncharacterized metal-binding protein YceD (DUF177 family)
MKKPERATVPSPEFSRRIVVKDLPPEGTAQNLVADAAEREALTRRFDLLALDELEAAVEVWPLRGGLVRVEGRFRATVTQSCVVTLEPVTSRLEEMFAVLYGPPAPLTATAKVEVEVAPDEEEGPPEPIEDGEIDLGEAIAQQLALAIDPYPRAPGASLAALSAYLEEPAGEAEQAESPFGALARLKERG